MKKQYKLDLSSLKDSWSASYVERQQVGAFSGGILHPRTMANLDSLGQGPEGRIRVGQKIAYPVSELIAWMESRAEVV
jgi:hypothetical protein